MNRAMFGAAKAKKLNREALAGILFALPWILGFAIFTVYPVGASLVYSFSDFNSFRISEWGFFNYQSILADKFFIDGFKNTLYMVLLNVPISTILGVLLGALLCSKTFGLKIYRTIYYLPSVVSIMAVTFLWQYMFNYTNGPINTILSAFGIAGPDWLNDPGAVKPALLIMNAWGVGGTILLYLAAFTNVPQELHEAARIDGAGSVRRFFQIVIPIISPTISFNVLMGLIGAFQYYLPAFIMTYGEPGRASYFLGQFIYENAFKQGLIGYSSAAAWLLMIVTSCIAALYFKISNKIVFYAGE